MHLNNIKQYNKKNVYALGDTHSLDFESLIKHYNLKDFVLIHCGDAGEGFNQRFIDEFDLDCLEKYCEENDGDILIVRGNHSNPSFYKPNHWTAKYKRITFVPDYTYYEINGKVVLFVGGATSIDRTRRDVNQDYWVDETFILRDDYETLPQADILVTHSCPTEAPPNDGFSNIAWYLKNDPALREDLIKERKNISLLYNHINPSILWHGHFHVSTSTYINGTWFRCFDINELVDVTPDPLSRISSFENSAVVEDSELMEIEKDQD
jgi:calcineurin-like phosphoesterase family protein